MTTMIQPNEGLRGKTGALGSVEFTTECCGRCGQLFAMPSVLFKALQANTGESFFCPRCAYSMSYIGKSETQTLREQLDAARRRADMAEETARGYRTQRDAADRRAAAAKGQVTKMRNRIASGVCPAPDCRRSGLGNDVVRHLTTCHPDFLAEHPEAIAAEVTATSKAAR